MMDLDKKYQEIVEKLDSMNLDEFQEMLVRCGMGKIKPSIEADYVRCLRKKFSVKNEEYAMHSVFKIDMDEIYNDFGMDNIGQGAA